MTHAISIIISSCHVTYFLRIILQSRRCKCFCRKFFRNAFAMICTRKRIAIIHVLLTQVIIILFCNFHIDIILKKFFFLFKVCILKLLLLKLVLKINLFKTNTREGGKKIIIKLSIYISANVRFTKPCKFFKILITLDYLKKYAFFVNRIREFS